MSKQYEMTEKDIKAIQPVLNTFDQLMRSYLQEGNPTEDLDLSSVNIVLNQVIDKFPSLDHDQKRQIHAIVHWQCIKFIQNVEDLDRTEQSAIRIN